MSEDVEGRARVAVRTLRQARVVFIVVGVLALVAAIIGGITIASASQDFNAGAAAVTGMAVVVYGIAGTIGCFAASAFFEGLASIVELLMPQRATREQGAA